MEKQDLKEQEKLNVKTSTIYIFLSVIFAGLTTWVEIASTALTLNFFKGLGSEGIVRNGTIGFAISNDIVKILGITLGMIAIKRRDKTNGRIFLMAGVLGLVVSFFASQAHDLNYAAKIRNETVTESSGYKRQEELYETAKNSLIISQEQLKKMTTIESYINNNNEIKELKKQLKDLGTLDNYLKKNNSDYGSKKYETRAYNKNVTLKNEYNNKSNNLTNKLAETEKRLRNEYTKLKSETENNIKKYSNNINKINSGFGNLENIELETTSGMEQFSKSYGWSIKAIATGKNSYLEFLGVVLALLMAFCWKMSKKLKYEEENGIEYNGDDYDGNNDGIINKIKNKINNRIGAGKEQQAQSQNTLEMLNSNLEDNIINKLKKGVNNLLSTKQTKKVNLDKQNKLPRKIGYDLPHEKVSEQKEKSEPEIKETKTENKMSKLTKLDFLKFISALYNPATMYLKQYGTGYKKITDQTKLDKTKVKKIRDCLEILEIIETKTIKHGNRDMNVTQLNTTKAEALKKIFKIGGVL